jgi:hypothetical protein
MNVVNLKNLVSNSCAKVPSLTPLIVSFPLFLWEENVALNYFRGTKDKIWQLVDN